MKKQGRPPLTTDIFIQRAMSIHGNTYDYSKTNYTKAQDKIIIVCKIHGEFKTLPNNHLRNENLGGCPKCGAIRMGKKHKKDILHFTKKSKQKHGDRYDYSKSVYTKAANNIIIICKEHGEFEQQASRHLLGAGCPKCKLKLLSNARRYTPEKWIKNAKKVHGNKYIYPDLNILNGNSKITIICKKHGEFKQKIRIHVMGFGCKICGKTLSKGEGKIISLLKKQDIVFEMQKTIKGCSNKVALRFDFYLPQYDLFIEYDGIQHFKPVNYFGGEKTFQEIQKKDNIKNSFCRKNKIKLLRIAYNENIEQKLKEAKIV